jgi:flagellar basal-body rod modification protein FlgD
MEITTSNVSQAAAALALPSSENTSVLSSDFETFIKMLTTQAKYQDPLEPIDSSEYAAQLAQFSMVEQQVQSNELLAHLTEQLGGSNMAGMANWIGMEARTAAPTYFDGAPITVAPTIPIGADECSLWFTMMTVHRCNDKPCLRPTNPSYGPVSSIVARQLKLEPTRWK